MIWFILIIVALLANLVAQVMMLVVSFKTSVGWGLAVMFIPFAVFVFIFKYWDKAQKPVAVYVLGMAMGYLGVWQLQGADLANDDWGALDQIRVALVEGMKDGSSFDSGSGQTTASIADSSASADSAKGESFLSDILKASEKEDGQSSIVDVLTDSTVETPVSTERQWVGEKIDDVIDELGAPTARFKRGQTVFILYGQLELVSDNGVTITSQSFDK
jgi:hypothetical protein